MDPVQARSMLDFSALEERVAYLVVNGLGINRGVFIILAELTIMMQE